MRSSACGVFVASFILAFSTSTSSAFARDYYVTPSGSDLNDGSSAEQAFRSLDRINKLRLSAGDRVLLNGDSVFTGTLRLDASDSGTSESPVVITSFPEGTRATIRPLKLNGIEARDVSHVRIENLSITGKDPKTGDRLRGNGIWFVSTQAGLRPSGAVIRNVKASSFSGDRISGWRSGNGILFDTAGEGPGYRDVLIEDTDAFDNDYAGIMTDTTNGNRHENVTLRRVQAYRNKGTVKAKQHSGNGILIGAVNVGLIEHSRAFENGGNSRSKGAGPVGIWAWASDRIVIRKSQSFRNRTGSNADGGGFDFDGDVTNSLMEDNESWENDGAGYLLCTYPGSGPVKNVIIRRNKSTNDGRRNSYGAITFSGDIQDALIEQNEIHMTSGHCGLSQAFRFLLWEGDRLEIRDNRIELGNRGRLLGFAKQPGIEEKSILFEGNELGASSVESPWVVNNGWCSSTYEQWRAGKPGWGPLK